MTPNENMPQDVVIHLMSGAVFHARVGDGSMDSRARTAAIYDMIAADEPIAGSWRDSMRAGRDVDPEHRTILHIAGRHAVAYVVA